VNHSHSVKNLIFDLGGVIIDLSVNKTMESFSILSGIHQEKVNEIYTSTPGFEAYEKGLINDDDFRAFVRDTFAIQSSDPEIDRCWNAMLLGLPLNKLELLLSLKEKYNVFLLSNTNNIHIEYVNGIMLPAINQNTTLDRYVHRAYYSHIMKKRKPDADIFEEVLEENNLRPELTLFLDDNADNIDAAKRLGIKTAHVQSPNFILDYFNGS
jgi:putative hydrolase of the HAD superfamily